MGFLSKLLLALAVLATFGWVIDVVSLIKAEAFQPRIMGTTVVLVVLWGAAVWSHRKHRKNEQERPAREALEAEEQRQTRRAS